MLRSLLPLLAGRLLLPLLQLPDVSSAYQGHWEDYKYGRPESGQYSDNPPCSWKCMLFTLQWPGGFCQSLESKFLCKIPPNINAWIIHGLWPQKAEGCCRSWPIFRSDLQELEEQLERLWPSLLTTTPSFNFWEQEWKKHGVCAACAEGMNSPLKYFQLSLKLQGHFDLHSSLEAAGITPSCQRLYKVAEVESALAPLVGASHEIQCVRDEQGREVWFQVKVSLYQNLTIGCRSYGDDNQQNTSAGHPCPANTPFYFLPIDHERPQRPCG